MLWKRRKQPADETFDGKTYVLFDHPEQSERLGPWEGPVGQYRDVVGYSALGHIFLRDPDTSDYVVLHPLAAGSNAKRYGEFASLKDFEASVLQDPSFQSEILRPHDVQTLRRRLGALGPHQVYFPVPYPMIGGSGELSTFNKGDVWVFLAIVGQMRGLE